MTAQQLAGNTSNTEGRIFDVRRLREELHHPHPIRQAAAYAAARAVLALAEDRCTFFEGTRAEVWAHILDEDRLRAEIERRRPSRNRPVDPLRAVGAQLVIDAIARLVALRSSTENAIPQQLFAQLTDSAELRRVGDRLDMWMHAAETARRAA
jgi:hypothetical protein